MLLNEEFNSDQLDSRLRWLNEPQRWRVDSKASALIVEPQPDTDFWRKTHYGFEADTGHFLYAPVDRDFVLTTHVRFAPAHQYDQAGLMVRVNGECWIKTSVEYELDDPPQLGAVVTNGGYSDWSVQDFDPMRHDVWLRINRRASDFIVEHSDAGITWRPLRVTHLDTRAAASTDCGVYACSPKGAGFRAEFDFVRID